MNSIIIKKKNGQILNYKFHNYEACVEYLLGMGYLFDAIDEYFKELNYTHLHDHIKVKANIIVYLPALEKRNINKLSEIEPESLCEMYDSWANRFDSKNYQLINKKEYNLKQKIKAIKKNTKIFNGVNNLTDISKILSIIIPDAYERGCKIKIFPETNISQQNIAQILSMFCLKLDSFKTKKEYLTILGQINKETNINMETIFKILRSSITKTTSSPDLYELIDIIGKDEVRRRLNDSIQFMKNDEVNYNLFLAPSLITLINKISAIFGDHITSSKIYVRDSLNTKIVSLLNGINNGFPLSTCLRSELYQISDKPIVLEDRFLFACGITLVRRTLSVLCGLQSEIVGEKEIILQFQKAIDDSKKKNRLDDLSYKGLEELIKIAKGIRYRSRINSNDNYSSIAAKFVEKYKYNLDPTIMVIGGGHVVLEFMKCIANRYDKIIWVNRTVEKIKKAVKDIKGLNKDKIIFAELDRCFDLFPLVDVLFVAIDNRHNFITKERVEMLHKNTLIIDVSHPSVIEGTVNGRKYINVYNTNFGEFVDRPLQKEVIDQANLEIDKFINKL